MISRNMNVWTTMDYDGQWTVYGVYRDIMDSMISRVDSPVSFCISTLLLLLLASVHCDCWFSQ